LLTPFSL